MFREWCILFYLRKKILTPAIELYHNKIMSQLLMDEMNFYFLREEILVTSCMKGMPEVLLIGSIINWI
jgi:hypothetical protein